MCIASSILLLFINAFNLRLWYCKNPQKSLLNLLVVQEKICLKFLLRNTFLGNTRSLIGPDLNLGTRITLTSVYTR